MFLLEEVNLKLFTPLSIIETLFSIANLAINFDFVTLEAGVNE